MAIFIENIKARQIIDSRAIPALEVEIGLNNGLKAISQVPSGASKGKNEALELRDGDIDYLFSKSVLKAVNNVNNIISKELILKCPFNQYEIDNLLIELDGTKNLSNLGANAILGVSSAVFEAGAKARSLELFQYLGGINAYCLPAPMINIINGGIHSNNSLDFQEFMIVPLSAPSFQEALRMSLEVFNKLKEILSKKNFSISVGDEGGFSPDFKNEEDALELILDAIFEAGYTTDDIKLALDIASSEFYKNGKYFLKKGKIVYNSTQMADFLINLAQKYPVISIEDPLSQEDFEGWKLISTKMRNQIMLVGDDLFTTNSANLKKGIEENIANAILIKPNQIGTITKTLECVDLAKRAGYKTIISHRSGETESTLIADVAVGLNAGFIKTGSLSRGERTAKYNRLLRIEEYLGKKARYLGNEALNY